MKTGKSKSSKKKSTRKAPESIDNLSNDSVVEPLEEDEAIDELPEGDRRLILLHYFEGRSFREISVSVGKSEAASQNEPWRVGNR